MFTLSAWHLPLMAVLVLCAAPVAAAADDTKTVEVAILDILLERGIIDQATYEELLELAEGEIQESRELDLLESRLRRLQAPDVTTSGGKPGKLNWESDDGRWSLGLEGRLTLQADTVKGEHGNEAADENNFSVSEGRLAFFGKAGGENTTYKLEFDTPTQNSTDKGAKDFKLTDAWVNFRTGEATNVKIGQSKVPFGREVQIFLAKANLVGFSLATLEFAPDFEPGVVASGHSGDKGVQWWLGVSNGDGTGISNQDGKDGTGSTGLRKSIRVVANLLGEVAMDAAAFQTVNDGSTRVAFGGSYMVNDDQPQDLDGDGIAGDGRSNDHSEAYEVQVVSGPVSFLAEHFKRKAEITGAPDIEDNGYNAQVGVFVVPEKYEVVLRKSGLDLDADDDISETTLGFNVYGDKHNSKWSFDVSKTRNKDTDDKDTTRARVLYQIIF